MNASPNAEKPSEVATEKDPRWAASLSVTAGVAAWRPSEAVPPVSMRSARRRSCPTLRKACDMPGHGSVDAYAAEWLQIGCRHGDAIYYPLVYDGSSGTTGTADLHADADRVKGVLEITMGGKNTTFSQSILASAKLTAIRNREP
jgi:hypothetical protein